MRTAVWGLVTEFKTRLCTVQRLHLAYRGPFLGKACSSVPDLSARDRVAVRVATEETCSQCTEVDAGEIDISASVEI